MKLKITRGRLNHEDGRYTPYAELSIGYDFDPDVQITVRKYPKNTKLRIKTDDGVIEWKVSNEIFPLVWAFTRLTRLTTAIGLKFSDRQIEAIRTWGFRLDEIDLEPQLKSKPVTLDSYVDDYFWHRFYHDRD